MEKSSFWAMSIAGSLFFKTVFTMQNAARLVPCSAPSQTSRFLLAPQLPASVLKNYLTFGFAGRTTRLTPTAVKAVPTTVATVMISPNSSQAITAVVGGTR